MLEGPRDTRRRAMCKDSRAVGGLKAAGGRGVYSGPDLYWGFLGKDKASRVNRIIWVGFVLQEPLACLARPWAD